ncbi:MAG: hypothetical protein ACK4RZ_02560 [Paracoccaceae bacterium]
MSLLTPINLKALALALPIACAGTFVTAGDVVLPPVGTTTTKNDASLFLGLAWTFGGNGNAGGTPGVTLKLLSTNKRNAEALAAGVTYNFDGSFGCDLGVAHNGTDATVTLGYDICKRGVQMGLGGTKKPKVVAPALD